MRGGVGAAPTAASTRRTTVSATLRDYLTENSAETLEKNLREWGNVKGVRAAYKMLRSARYKCLLSLGRRLRGEPAIT